MKTQKVTNEAEKESPEFQKRLSKLENEILLINNNINISLQKAYIINPRALKAPDFADIETLEGSGLLGKFDELNYEVEKARVSLEALRDYLINLVG